MFFLKCVVIGREKGVDLFFFYFNFYLKYNGIKEGLNKNMKKLCFVFVVGICIDRIF